MDNSKIKRVPQVQATINEEKVDADKHIEAHHSLNDQHKQIV